MRTDHYQALGVSPQASHTEIREAYLRLMRASHPDVTGGDDAATERARRANEAWEVLGDAARRASYDQLRRRDQPGGPGVHTVRRPAQLQHPVAYSPAKADYGRAFQRVSIKVAVALLALGTVLLMVASA